MRARVVIVNWREPALTLRAAHSVQDQMNTGDRLVLVDNGSGDGSVAQMRAAGFDVLELPENRGFGAGVNAGAQGLDEDALVLLNNDAVAERGFLRAILDPMEAPGGQRVGATTGRILLSGKWARAGSSDSDALVGLDGSRWVRVNQGGRTLVNSTGNVVDGTGNGYDRDWLGAADSVEASAEVFGLCGGSCAIRRAAWEDVGPFREDLFMYYEDTEMSWRLHEAGWDIRYVSGATTHHDHAASSGTTSPMFIAFNARNRLLVTALHGPLLMWCRAVAHTVARLLRGPDRGPVCRGLREALRLTPRMLRERRRGLRRRHAA